MITLCVFFYSWCQNTANAYKWLRNRKSVNEHHTCSWLVILVQVGPASVLVCVLNSSINLLPTPSHIMCAPFLIYHKHSSSNISQHITVPHAGKHSWHDLCFITSHSLIGAGEWSKGNRLMCTYELWYGGFRGGRGSGVGQVYLDSLSVKQTWQHKEPALYWAEEGIPVRVYLR